MLPVTSLLPSFGFAVINDYCGGINMASTIDKRQELEQVEALLKKSTELVTFLECASKEFEAVNAMAKTSVSVIQRWDEIFSFMAPKEKLVKINNDSMHKLGIL